MTFEARRHLSSASYLPQLLRPPPSGAPWELPAPRCPFQRVTCLVGEATERPLAQGGRARLALHGWSSLHAPTLPASDCFLQSPAEVRPPPLPSHSHTGLPDASHPCLIRPTRFRLHHSDALGLLVREMELEGGRGAGDLVLIRKTVRVHRGLCPRQPTVETVIMGPSSCGPGIELESHFGTNYTLCLERYSKVWGWCYIQQALLQSLR